MPTLLPSTLDTAAAGQLRLTLKGLVERGEPLMLDGGGVDRIGQASLQVLVAARAAAGEAGLPFRIDAPSPALDEMARLAGLAILFDPA